MRYRKSGLATLPDPIFTCIRVSFLTIGCLHCGVLHLHYNPYKGVHVSTLEVKKSRAGCIMRPPFFFFNADTDCPHYLLGWVREPGMVLEPSPERRRRKRPSPLRMRLAATSTPWPGHSTAAAVPPSSWAFPSSGWPRWWSNSGR